jgi:pilus assembly protein CpaF
MGVIDRIGRAIAVDDTPLNPRAVEDHARRLLGSESPWKAEELAGPVVSSVLGFGPIQHLLDDSAVSDILANGPDQIWVDRGNGLELTTVVFGDVDKMLATIERAIAPTGLRIDRSAPMVDARLADGSRLHAVLPPASVDVPLLAIRRFTQRVGNLGDLVAAGSATDAQVSALVAAVSAGRTIVVSGGTGVGKTTLLNLLAASIPASERVVTIEDAAELALPGHVVRLEARPANTEGSGEITIRDLLRSALRLRPDRIIVGEVRGPEALDLVSALNTGHRGSLTTVHANSPVEALWRLETLALSAGETSELAVSRQLRAAVDLVVQLERSGPTRRISAIAGIDELEDS